MALHLLLHHDRTKRRGVRRAVASVLAMMFLVLFGSLAAAMAVVAQGNLRTADSAIKVSRAMSAAETGLVFATRRLEQETARFVVEEGVIDPDFAEDLWLGTLDAGEFTVLPPTGYTPGTPPAGIAEALVQAHAAEGHALVIEAGDSSLPAVDGDGTVLVAPIALEPGSEAAYFRLRYELLEAADAGDPMVRVTSEGHDGSIVRILRLDFSITKKIEFAILSPNRIMIGKNVIVEGPLGSRYGVVSGELDTENGDPLVLRSDFYHLNATLDAQLDMLYAEIVEHDVDGDARLRPDHPSEANAVVDGQPIADLDADGNEYVDDFDLFLAFYDTLGNGDGVLVYDAVLAGGPDEFDEPGDDPDQLGRLIDRATPDRNGDGIDGDATDVALGYNDGILDGFDQYAKVTGRIAFAVQQDAWEVANGDSYQTVVQGPVLPDIDEAPVSFEVSTDDMLDITTSMFDGSQSWFEAQVPDDGGTDFVAQRDAGGTYTPVDADPDTGVHNWESVPFGSSGAYDYYDRNTYLDMTFTNVRIPQGTNGLFKNCVFVGVTYVESDADCDHPNWNYAGSLTAVQDPDTLVTTYDPKFPDLTVDQGGGTIITDTRGNSNNIRFEDCVFLGSIAGDRLDAYTHWRNKLQMTGNTRVYLDASEVPPSEAEQVTLQGLLNAIPAADRTELRKSSLLMPGWSVDVGNFANAPGQSVNLKGTIIAGILDVRGTAEVHGTLLMSHRAVEGEGPLYYGGQTDAFNTTIGYFGPTDGDSEGMDPSDPDFNGFGEIRLRYDPDALLPDGIPWPVRAEMVPQSYVEGGV